MDMNWTYAEVQRRVMEEKLMILIKELIGQGKIQMTQNGTMTLLNWNEAYETLESYICEMETEDYEKMIQELTDGIIESIYKHK